MRPPWFCVGAVAVAMSATACSNGCRNGDDPPHNAATSAEPQTRTDSAGGSPRGPFPPADGSVPIVDLGKATLELNPEDRTLSATLWNTGTWEEQQTKVLLDGLQPGQTVVDVGANIGYYTVLAAKKVGPTGRVFAFEPDPESFALLKRNVERNELSNVVVENKAAGADKGVLRLFLNSANRGDHRVYDPGGGRASIEVEVVALDRYFADAGGPLHRVKIDTRGAECAILDGMDTLLREHKEMSLTLAYYPQFVTAMGHDPKRCFGALAELGFTVSWIDEAKRTVTRTTVDALPPEDGALWLPPR